MDAILIAVALGVVLAGATAKGGHALYTQVDAIRGYSRLRDVLARAAIVVVGVLLAAAGGAVYGWRWEGFGHDPIMGALWGLAGGALSPWLWLRVVGAFGSGAEALAGKARADK